MEKEKKKVKKKGGKVFIKNIEISNDGGMDTARREKKGRKSMVTVEFGETSEGGKVRGKGSKKNCSCTVLLY